MLKHKTFCQLFWIRFWKSNGTSHPTPKCYILTLKHVSSHLYQCSILICSICITEVQHTLNCKDIPCGICLNMHFCFYLVDLPFPHKIGEQLLILFTILKEWKTEGCMFSSLDYVWNASFQKYEIDGFF